MYLFLIKKKLLKYILGLMFEIVEFNVCFIFIRFLYDFFVKKLCGFNVINNFFLFICI